MLYKRNNVIYKEPFITWPKEVEKELDIIWPKLKETNCINVIFGTNKLNIKDLKSLMSNHKNEFPPLSIDELYYCIYELIRNQINIILKELDVQSFALDIESDNDVIKNIKKWENILPEVHENIIYIFLFILSSLDLMLGIRNYSIQSLLLFEEFIIDDCFNNIKKSFKIKNNRQLKLFLASLQWIEYYKLERWKDVKDYIIKKLRLIEENNMDGILEIEKCPIITLIMMRC